MQHTEISIQQQILLVRDQRVMLDFELAALYGVETKALNQAVKRNIERFPADFMFQLTQGEWALISNNITLLQSQNVTANLTENQDDAILRSQIVTILSDQNDINEMTQAQLDAISEALAELQEKPRPQQRQRIGYVKDNNDNKS